jgi:hypothetical protein
LHDCYFHARNEQKDDLIPGSHVAADDYERDVPQERTVRTGDGDQMTPPAAPDPRKTHHPVPGVAGFVLVLGHSGTIMSISEIYFTVLPFDRRCENCGKDFKFEEAFYTHRSCYPQHLMKGDTVKCDRCPYTGPFHNLRMHYVHKHLDPKFMCIMQLPSGGICGEKFCTKQMVLKHVDKHWVMESAGMPRKRRRASETGPIPSVIVTDPLPDQSEKIIIPKEEPAGDSDQDVKPELITAAPVPCDSAPAPIPVTAVPEPVHDPVVVKPEPESETRQNDLLDISLHSLLRLLFHCPKCTGYFLTEGDMQQHFSAHP